MQNSPDKRRWLYQEQSLDVPIPVPALLGKYYAAMNCPTRSFVEPMMLKPMQPGIEKHAWQQPIEAGPPLALSMSKM